MMRLRRRLAAARGFSTVETSAIVLGMAIVAGTAGPQLQEYLDLARQTKATGDTRVLAVSMLRLITDVGRLRLPSAAAGAPRLLVSAGEIPTGAIAETAAWTVLPDAPGTGLLEDHLVRNGAGYAEDMPTGRWRGPYLDHLTPDPWGRRYASNVSMLGRPGITIVISAGPDGAIDTPFLLRRLQPAGDDVVAVVWMTR